MELARQVGRLDAQVRRGDWGGIDGIGLHGKKLGLVGFGGIGRTVARIANGFGMKTLVWNSHVHGIDGLDITLIDDMDEVFAQSDIISLHLPLLDGTAGIITSRQLDRMRQVIDAVASYFTGGDYNAVP